MVVGVRSEKLLSYNASVITGFMMYPETLLVFRKDRKNFMEEAEKLGTFMVVTIEANIVGEYIRGQKGMKYAAS